MARKRDLWTSAANEAKLTGDERERLALAVARDDGLGAEVTYLLAHLSADLSGVFLRAFVDRLGALEEPDDAGLHVIGALEQVVSPAENRDA